MVQPLYLLEVAEAMMLKQWAILLDPSQRHGLRESLLPGRKDWEGLETKQASAEYVEECHLMRHAHSPTVDASKLFVRLPVVIQDKEVKADVELILTQSRDIMH